MVAFNLFKDLNMQNAIICSCIIIALLGLSYWRLKIGAVKKEDLELRKEQIVKAALAAEE
jgi:amino acid permease family protein